MTFVVSANAISKAISPVPICTSATLKCPANGVAPRTTSVTMATPPAIV
ncbi:Uncharacterised protein [Mycobacterium tuberculosis]|nr:Uncharacterised protein [Mycobacterium tuberculosis]COY26898.1 Uncharacterised protein [Mycobacterium tuberculosis]